MRRLVRFRFPGPVWPVNRTARSVAGLSCYPRLADLPGVPDLAVLAIPAAALIDALRDCVAVGVRYGIAYAGGLAESGGEGAELQRSVAALCRQTGFRLCGPNCVGIVNTGVPVTATFATALHELDSLRSGVVSVLSQSGGIGTTALSMMHHAGFGVRCLISSGNEAVLDFSDYLYALARDDGTQVIAGYLEGVADGPKLIRALEETQRRRRAVVLIKAGTTSTSARAALAHTGALVGEDRVFDAVLREMGVIRAYSVEELVDLALMLAGETRRPTGRGVGIVTFGGGNGVLAADQCAQSGLAIPELSADCVDRLRPFLVPVATAANPLDLTPTTAFRAESLAQLPTALEVIAAEPDIHSLLLIVGSLAAQAAEISDVIAGFWRNAAKPVCVSWPSPPVAAITRLAERGICAFAEPARAVRALSRLVARDRAAVRPSSREGAAPIQIDWAAYVHDRHAPFVIPEHRCHAILAAAGLPVAAGALARDEAGALQAADTVGLPVVLKGISPQVTHRAAAGLLAVDLRTHAEIVAAFRQLTARARDLSVPLDGIYVQRMQKDGVELLVSAFRDPLFGTMVACGSGGGFTEMIDDVVTRRAPIDQAAATEILTQLRIFPRAGEGGETVDVAGAADFVARFSRLAAGAPWRRFVFEVNPV
ncbi:MAG TPA: acetate--CoA ligase family protein, partial [bacterium]|nr:acetate--CoA ligase family protein [bacterium]